MQNRFDKLFELKKNLYIEKTPVIISAGELLFDNISRSSIIQLKIQNIAEKRIKAIEVSIDVFNIIGECIEDVKYQYLDLNSSYGEYIGIGKAIVISAENSRTFLIKKLSVVYFDDSICNLDFNNCYSLINEKELSTYFKNESLFQQYTIETTNQSKFLPKDIDDIWICACGSINRHDMCIGCNKSKSEIFEYLNKDYLTSQIKKRKEQELKEKEQREQEQKKIIALQKKKEDELRRLKEEKRRKTKKALIGVASILAVVLLSVGIKEIVKRLYIIPKGIYNTALELKNKQSYEEAITEFNKIQNFKDSMSQLEECKALLKNEREAIIEKYSVLQGKWVSSYEYVNQIVPDSTVRYVCQHADVLISIVDNIPTLTISFQIKHKDILSEFQISYGYINNDFARKYKFLFNLEDMSLISGFSSAENEKKEATATLNIIDENHMHIDIEGTVYESGIDFLSYHSNSKDIQNEAKKVLNTSLYSEAIDYAKKGQIDEAYDTINKVDKSFKNAAALSKRMKLYIDSGFTGCWRFNTGSYPPHTSWNSDGRLYTVFCPYYIDGNIYFISSDFYTDELDEEPTSQDFWSNILSTADSGEYYFALQNNGTLKEISDYENKQSFVISKGKLVKTGKNYKEIYTRYEIVNKE